MTTTIGAPTSAMAVANWFILRAKNDTEFPVLTQLKLYKLVYFAHAWYLGNGKGPLFAEDIEAWQHGPVVRDLYNEFKDAGGGPITKLGTKFTYSNGFVKPETPTCTDDKDIEAFLESVWGAYKKHDGFQLSNATHAQGEPWTIVKESRGLAGSPTIPSELIQQVYSAKVEKTRQH